MFFLRPVSVLRFVCKFLMFADLGRFRFQPLLPNNNVKHGSDFQKLDVLPFGMIQAFEGPPLALPIVGHGRPFSMLFHFHTGCN